VTGSDHSFIIPAYGDCPYLEDCILSLKNQSIQSEILIVTSTPSDHISRLAERYGIEVRINSGEAGLANDWNFAYRQCKTKYLTIAHQDDVYYPEYVTKCLQAAGSRNVNDELILFTDYQEIAGGNIRRFSLTIIIKRMMLFAFIPFGSASKSICKRMLLAFGNSISCPTVMYNTKNIGSFQFNNGFRYNLDWDAWLQLAAKSGRFIYVGKKLMGHRLHAGSETSKNIGNRQRMVEEKQILQTIWGRWLGEGIFFFYRFGGRLAGG
jgi:glycosyltransferase involved in cell wall biosynthesis